MQSWYPSTLARSAKWKQKRATCQLKSIIKVGEGHHWPSPSVQNSPGSDPAGAATAAVCSSRCDRRTTDILVTVGTHVARHCRDASCDVPVQRYCVLEWCHTPHEGRILCMNTLRGHQGNVTDLQMVRTLSFQGPQLLIHSSLENEGSNTLRSYWFSRTEVLTRIF